MTVAPAPKQVTIVRGQDVARLPGWALSEEILNTQGGHGAPLINPEKLREINGGEIRSLRAG